jgi:arabinofuranosyltransferase
MLFTAAGAFLCYAFFRFTVDDTFISLRFASNLAQGLGPVFNTGERVEGFSTPLWVALLAVIAWLPQDAFVTAKILSAGFYLASGWVIVRSIAFESRDPSLAGLLFLATLPLVIWGVSGMETALFAFLLLLWGQTICAPNPGDGRIVAIALLLTATRPEAPLPLAIGFLLLLRRRKLSVFMVAIFLAGIGALLAARYTYYGDLLPNTYYAKRFQTLSRWPITLWNYVRGFYLGPGLVPVLFVAVSLFRATRVEKLALASPESSQYLASYETDPWYRIGLMSLCLWPAAFSILVGGDWMPLWRFLLPSLPFCIWIAGRTFGSRFSKMENADFVPGVSAWRRGMHHWIASAFIAIHLYLCLSPTLATQPPDLSPPDLAPLEASIANGNPHYAQAVSIIKALDPMPRNLVVGELGFFCFRIRVPCLDLHGLIDPVIARSNEFPGSVIGKRLPIGDPEFASTAIGRYILDREPDVWVVSLEELGGEPESLMDGRFRRIRTVGNFGIYRGPR